MYYLRSAQEHRCANVVGVGRGFKLTLYAQAVGNLLACLQVFSLSVKVGIMILACQ